MIDFPLDELSTDKHTDLAAAQRTGLDAVAGALARAIRAGIDSGRYVVEDGVVKLAEFDTILIIPSHETCG